MKQLLILLSVLVCSDLSFAQNYQWTWVSGANIPSQGSISGTKGMPSVSNAPGAREPAAYWTDNNGNFWVFGGEGGWVTPPGPGAGDLNDLWKYNPATNEWTWVSGDAFFNQSAVYGTKGAPSVGNKPGARTRSAGWTDKNGNLWLFGGIYGAFGGGTTTFLNDLWKFNPSTNEWTWVGGSNTPNQPAVYGTKGAPSSLNTPPALCRATCWTDHNGVFWLYGGESPTSVVDDLWKYDPSTNQWTWVTGNHAPVVFPNFGAVYGTKKIPSPSNSPGARLDAAGWVDANNNLWLFGAGPGFDMLNDLWKYDPALNEWTWVNGSSNFFSLSVLGTKGIPAPGNQPSCRYASLGLTDSKGQLWLFGGNGMGTDPVVSDVDLMNDLWKYDPVMDEWAWMSGDPGIRSTAVYGTKGVPNAANKPGGRMWPAGWVDGNDNLWLFAGSGYGVTTSTGAENDLWGFAAAAQISITAVAPSAICPGAQLDITFITTGPFQTGNIFTAQLSDASGSFVNPVDIGTTAATNGTLTAVIPANTPSGSGYRVRLTSSAPNGKSPDNGSDITVYGKMTVSISAANTTDLCPGKPVLLTALVTGGETPYQYMWSNGAIDPAITLSPTTDIIPTLTVTDGCSGQASSSIALTLTRQTLSVGGNAPLCPNSSLQLNAHSGFMAYKWQDGSADSVFTVKNPGPYSVTVTDNCGQNFSQQVKVLAAPPVPSDFLPADTAICSYDQLPVKASGTFKNYTWSTGETTGQITVTTPGLYWLQITDDNNCIARDSIQVDAKACLEGFFMPSAFSPNGDGKNDILRPRLYGIVRHMDFAVFNRWGQKVFETTQKDKGWDGRAPTGEYVSGTFIWICEYQLEGQRLRKEKGTVIAVR